MRLVHRLSQMKRSILLLIVALLLMLEGGLVWAAVHVSQRPATPAAVQGTPPRPGASGAAPTPGAAAPTLAPSSAGIELRPSVRPYAGPFANCLFISKGKCGACIKRCPGGAISEKGHDKLKCYEVLAITQKPWLEGAHGEGYIGQYAGCGLCQTGVPCESRIPVKPKEEA